MPGVRSCLSRLFTFGCGVVFCLGVFGISAQAQLSAVPGKWTQLSPASSPSGRYGAGIAYDQTRQNTVLFGGIGVSAYSNDTWTWNGTTWTQLSPANSPSARASAGMVYDAATGTVVLFGGTGSSGLVSDTWTWNGTTWTQLSPAVSPSARSNASMVYDAATGNVVLFGGRGSSATQSDTWIWDGTTWTQLTPASNPPARDGASMIYDSATGRVVLFGGRDATFGPLNDTWTWNGTTWTQLSPSVAPTARSSASSAYDASTGNTVLFGGLSSSSSTSVMNDTWLWNGVNWKGETLAGSPSARNDGQMFYEPATGSTLLFGGFSGSGVLNDMWRFTTGQDLGTVNVGATASSTITFTFTGSGTTTLAVPSVLTMGAPNLDFTDAGTGTCTTNGTGHSYAVGDSCTVDAVFTPKFAGTRKGAVVLKDNSSNVIATIYIHGIGQGPQAAFRSNAPTSVGGGLTLPVTTAVDGAGNVYSIDGGTNKLDKIPAGCTSSACVSTVGGGFVTPQAATVDGSGTLYVVEAISGSLKKMAPDCPSSACVTTLISGFSNAAGVTTDGNGNIYIADNSTAVKKVPAGCSSSSCVTVLGGGIGTPTGLAVDGDGAIYVAAYTQNAVKKIPANCFSSSCVATLGGGFDHPLGVALDAAGNIYVADPGTSHIKKMADSCASSSCVSNLASGVVPRSMSSDAAGNLYFADLLSSTVKEIVAATPPTLTFTTTTAGSTSTDSPQTVTVENIGNQPLSFPIPTTGTNPSMASAPDFSLNSTGTTKCPLISSSSSSAGSLPVAATCDLTVSFTPQLTPAFGGSVSEPLLLTDNTLNASAPGYATQSVTLKGTVTATGPYFTIADPGPWVSYSPVATITVTAHNADGTIDTAYAGTVLESSSDPGFGNFACAAPVNGVIACTAGFKQAGLQTYTVTDQAGLLLPATIQITVVPGAITHFNVSAPSSAIVGTPISVSVTAGDLYNNTVTGYTGTVHFTSSATSAVLPSDYTFVAGDGGIHTFSATLKTVGNQTITASDTGTPTITGASSDIAVANPQLVVTTNTDGAANAAHCTAQAAAGTGTDANCSLRDALAFATAAGGGDISFDATKFAAATTINLTSGTLILSNNTSIQGATSGSGATLKNLVTVSGGFPSTNFTVLNATGTNSSLANMILTRGNGSTGGAIKNSGTLTVKQCTLVFNAAVNGGGIYNSGTLTLDSSTVSGNSAAVAGGGIVSSGPLTVLSSTISGNAALGSVLAFGGGIQSSAALVIEQSTISNNIASASSLGGIAQGAGIYLASGTLALSNSIVGANTFSSPVGISADISGNYTDGGGNQASNNSAPISTLSLLKLSALGNYGGPVQTIVPLPGSAAICGGLAANIPSGVTTDQRGYSRTTTYDSTTCVDAGSTQSSYAIAFAQQPSNVVQNAAMSPAPTVKLTENGAAFSPAITIPLTLIGSGTLSGGSVATSSGTATYSSLKVDTAGTGDKLTAKLALNSSATLSISATSDPFNVGSAVSQLVFGTAPATPITLGGNAGASVTVKEADSSGTTVATATDTITLAVTGPNSYSQSHTATAVNGVATFDLSSVALNNAGDYIYKASLGSTSTNATETVNKGTAAITLGGLSATYDGNSHAVTATTVPSGLTATFTYDGSSTAPTAPGSYAVVATVNDANYQGSQTGTLVIAKAAAIVTLGNLSATYDGNSHAATATTSPSGLTVSFTYNGSSTAPTAAGSYAVVATVNDANYQGSQTGTLVIGKTTPVVTWSAPSAITYGTALSSTQLNASANTSGSFAYTPVAGTVLSAGANQTLSVSFTPTDATNYNTASKSVQLTVNKQGTTLALAASATAITPLQTVTFTAAVAPVSSGTPTGTVTFYDGTTALQTVALTGNSATYTASLLSGSHTISAIYNGDGNYLTATAASSVGVTVAPLDFTLTQQGANFKSVLPGGSAEFTYLISPTYGTYPGTVALQVTGLPPGATYTLSQSSISATGGVQQFTLSVKTAALTAINHTRTPWSLAFLLLPLAGATRMRKRSRKLAQSLFVGAMALAGIASMTGCGTGNGYFGQEQQNYNITVTATSGSVQHTSTVILQVQ